MRFFKSKYLKYFIALSLFAIAYILTHKNWYLSFDPISYGDIGFLYKNFFTDLFNTLSPIWNAGMGFGSNSQATLNYFGFNFLGSMLSKFGFDYNIILRGMMFYPLLVGIVGSVLIMARVFKDNVIAAVIFGLIFTINTLVVVFWLNLLVAYAFLPLIFFTLYKYLNEKRIIWLLIFSLLFACALFYEVRIGFIAFLLVAIFTLFYWIYRPVPRKVYLTQLIHLIFSLGIAFLLSAFFIFPMFQKESMLTISGITSQSLFGTQFYNLQYSITLMHPFWNGDTFQVFQQQPLKFYFWFYPIFAFSALFFARKDKKIIYFSLIAVLGIFMGKGANPPFGFIYSWLYYNLPFFNFFREPVQWWVIIGFSYAVLIGYFFYYAYQEIERRIRPKFPKGLVVGSLAKILITLPIVFVTLAIAVPAYNGSLGHGLNPVSFAKEYDLFREFLLNKKDFFRVLNVPSIQRFTYYSDNHPSVVFANLQDNLKSLNTKLLSLEGVRYVMLPNDVLGDVFVNSYNSKQYKDFIESSNSNQEYKALEKVKGIGNITLWENPNDTPHLMAVKDLVYVTGPLNLTAIIGIPTSKQVAYYSEQNISPDATKSVRDVITKTNDAMYKNATKIYAVADCVRCDLGKKYYDYVQFPFARFLPDNLLYPIIEAKENKKLSALISPEEKFKEDAFFIEKRAVEIQMMKLNPLTRKKYVISTLNKTNLLLDDMGNKFKQMDSRTIDNGLLSTLDYLYTARRTYDDSYRKEDDKEIRGLLSKITYRLDDLIAKVSQKLWLTKDDNKKLIVNLPENGDYSVFMKNDDEVNLSEAQLIVDGNELQKASATSNGFLSYGNYQLNKGEHFLELNTPSVNLLDLPSPSSNIAETDNVNIVSLKDSKASYHLSFDYKSFEGRTARIFISDDAYPVDANAANSNLVLDKVLKDYNSDNEWHHFDIFFNPYNGIKKPVLHLKGEASGSGAEFRNLSLIKVITPTIVFVIDTGKVLDTPKITYQKITSTDYILKIENAKSPFLLSFSEQFDGNWTTLTTSNQDFYGNDTVVKKYFDSNVLEMAYVNKFEPAVSIGSLINDRGMDSLHMSLNGFANGWLISKNGTYQIHLTFFAQRYFLAGLAVSLLTFMVVLLSIGYLLLKRRKKLR